MNPEKNFDEGKIIDNQFLFHQSNAPVKLDESQSEIVHPFNKTSVWDVFPWFKKLFGKIDKKEQDL